MRCLLVALVALFAAISAVAGVHAQENPPQVDQAEVMRLGDTVQHVGSHTQAGEYADAFVDAMSPPESDADKWFVSVVSMRGCAACEKLKRDWAANQWLLALANPADPKKSWAHFKIYDKDDQSQAFRWEKIKITAYPTILVQPPRSGRYGDAATVVFQGVYQGNPASLARSISSAIRQYIARLQSLLGPVQVRHFGQVGVDPPWQPVPQADPLQPQPTPQFPPFDPTIPPQPPAPAPAPPTPAPAPAPTPAPAPAPASDISWTSVLALLAAGFSAPVAIALVIWGGSYVRARRRAAGKPLLLDQETFDELISLLRRMSSDQSKPPSSEAAGS